VHAKLSFSSLEVAWVEIGGDRDSLLLTQRRKRCFCSLWLLVLRKRRLATFNLQEVKIRKAHKVERILR